MHWPLRVHRQDLRGGAAHWRLAGNSPIIQGEVVGPVVGTGVKEPDELAGERVYARDVRAFVAIAVWTREREIG